MSRRLAKKVLLLGWDAADWQIIQPLLDAGQMPALERLINKGVMGNIATLQPAISPILWNSIATGKLPEKHGIFGFAEPSPDGTGIRCVNSTSRKTKAIWNILTQAGLRSHVVGWFASHPAEPINGVCVSNQFATGLPSPGQAWTVPPQSVHPMGLASQLADLRVHPAEMDGALLQPFIPLGTEIDQTLPVEQRRLNALRKYLADCASTHAVATWLMEHEPWDFTAVYYNAIDLICHHFMPFHPPRMPSVSEQEFKIYKDVVRGMYRFHDMMLERLLDLAGEDCTIILLSDHGFYSDHLRPASPQLQNDPVAWHRAYGVFCMKGPSILQDERIYGTSLVDVVPTILALFGLPIGEDMDGKALLQAFVTPPEIESVPTWDAVPGECGMHPPELVQDTVTSREALQHLVDLGYMAEPSEDIKKAVKRVMDDLQCNRGVALLNYGESKKCVPIFKQLVSNWPGERRYRLFLAQAHFGGSQWSEARLVLDELLRNHPDFAAAQIMMGSLLLAENQHEGALAYLHRAEKMMPGSPHLYIRLGNAYVRGRRWHEAERSFQQALKIDGDNAEACHGFSVACLRLGRIDEAAEFALRAVGLQHFFPAAHFQLGSVLARLNQPVRAALAFEHGLTMKPGVLVAHRYLARLYYRLGNLEKCHEHQETVSRLRMMAKAA